MSPRGRARDPPDCDAPHREGGPARSTGARSRAAGWIAVSISTAAAIGPGCLDEQSGRDPLRIPWSRLSIPASPRGLPARENAVTAAEEAPEAEDGRAASRRRELHSPLELAAAEYRSATLNTCRTAGCHADLEPRPEIHSRIAAMACTRCHVPIGEPREHRFCMTEADGGICTTCHVPRGGTGVRHAPFLESRCLACHSPHRSVESKLLLEEDGARVCRQCHEAASEAFAHRPHAEGQCLSCHAAHESEFDGLTWKRSADLCLGCHDREVPVSGRERPLPDMAAFIRSSRFAHGPIRAGDCSACHDSHGGPRANLLRGAFPDDFYQAWDPTRYELCFRCHPTDLATEARTTTRTGFRDGDRNLHYVHVNREKGRSCRACHEVHASNAPFHMRESVPFGQWELPIVYAARPNGGVCGASCHHEASYDRTRPTAANELVQPPRG